MVSIFKFMPTGSLFVITEEYGFFVDKDGDFIKKFMNESGFIRDIDLCKKMSTQLMFLKQETPSQLPLYIKQPIILSSVTPY